jgi:hypothetical protein
MNGVAIMTKHPWIDVTETTEAKTALLCARLHLRDGKSRLQKGYQVAGIAALYNSLLFGMQYYITRHKGCADFLENRDPWDGANLFQALARAGVFDDPLLFNRLSLMVERALWQTTISSDPSSLLADVENILTKLGVLPAQGFSQAKSV